MSLKLPIVPEILIAMVLVALVPFSAIRYVNDSDVSSNIDSHLTDVATELVGFVTVTPSDHSAGRVK